MKKNVKLIYARSGEVIKVKVCDYSGKPIEQYKFNGSDGKEYGRVLKELYRKYGFKPEIEVGRLIERAINEENKKGFFDF